MKIVSYAFGIIFVITGVLNLFLVHLVPGTFYLLLSLLYFPLADATSTKWFGLKVPFALKVILGLVILWGTLAVGDLAEILGL